MTVVTFFKTRFQKSDVLYDAYWNKGEWKASIFFKKQITVYKQDKKAYVEYLFGIEFFVIKTWLKFHI